MKIRWYLGMKLLEWAYIVLPSNEYEVAALARAHIMEAMKEIIRYESHNLPLKYRLNHVKLMETERKRVK